MRFPVLKKIGDTALWGNQADFQRRPEFASYPWAQMLTPLRVSSELPSRFCLSTSVPHMIIFFVQNILSPK